VWLSFPAGVLLLVLGPWIMFHASSNITPRSVSVRGYHRADGTYVRPYHRRPPGSVAHDRPYEQLRILGFFLTAGGAVFAYASSRRLFFESPENLLPPLPLDAPPRRPVVVRVPISRATARRRWSCEQCRSEIDRGTQYWFFESSGRYSMRHRFCGSCRALLASEAGLHDARMRHYEDAVRTYYSDRRRRLEEQFRLYYGCDP
jgi:hypothetical protein